MQSKSIIVELNLPAGGLTLPMVSPLKTEPFTITDIALEFPLVYDREFTRCLEGDYACPDNAPEIKIFIGYHGSCVDKKERILDY